MNDEIFLQVFAILGTIILIPLIEKLKVNAVIGYLLIGLLVGPNGIGVIDDLEGALALAEIGIVFLLFTLGLELSLDRLKSMRLEIFGIGAMQVGLSTLAIGSIAWLLGLPAGTALIIGAALAMSSTAVVIQMLQNQGDMLARVGRISFAILLFQDMAVAPVLAMVPLVAEGGNVLMLLGGALLRAIAAVTILFLFGRYVLQPLFRLAAGSGHREVFVALVLFSALGTGWLTHHAGLSMALGAFLSGLMLAGTVYRHQIETDIEPFKGILLGLFFMTVGMIIDPTVIIGQLPIILAFVVTLLVIKAAILLAVTRLFGTEWPRAVRVSLLLAEGGEFAFVILGLVLSRNLLPLDTVQIIIASVAVTMALTPLLAAVGKHLHEKMGRRPTTANTLGEEVRDLRDHVIILGFGRVGQTVARMLADLHVPHLALDMDPQRVANARRKGSMVFYGNADHWTVMTRAGIERARAVVVTIDQTNRSQKIVSLIRSHLPDLLVLVRAHDNKHARVLEQAGASRAVPEALEASLQLGRAVLTSVGMPIDDIRQQIDRIRREHYEPIDPYAGKTGHPAD